MIKYVSFLSFLLLTLLVSCSIHEHAGITSTGNTTKISGFVVQDSGAAVLSRRGVGVVSMDSSLFGVRIYLGRDTFSVVDSVETDSNGYFEFENLEPGVWVVQALGDSGWVRSTVALSKGDSVRVSLELYFSADSHQNSGIVHGPDVEYEGERYATVVIGTQIWFARNLNVAADTSHSWCYENLDSNCLLLGRLYDWATAMAIDTSYNNREWGGDDVNHQGLCPAGWHLPRDGEWSILEKAVGGDSVAAKTLRAVNLWVGTSGDDLQGFTALPAGLRNPDSTYQGLAQESYFWTATENLSVNADDIHLLSTSTAVMAGDHYKGYGFSVRCMKASE